jgi:starch synthase (maltosyl-transferring)
MESAQRMPAEGRQRVAIARVAPELDCGRFPVKRIVGDEFIVEADIFADGHDELAAVLRYRGPGETGWREVPMTFLGNDRWRASFCLTELGLWDYTVLAWIDRFATWQRDLRKRVEAGQDVRVDLLIGAELLESIASATTDPDASFFRDVAARLRSDPDAVELALDPELAARARACDPRVFASEYPRVLRVMVDRERARFSTWYELFPRSCAPEPGRHGTFRDCEAWLPHIAELGFDVLYLPPIHPIGRTHRKGKNNSLVAGPDDPGSPWAIGSEEGGHDAIHPQLGTLEDFRRFVARGVTSGSRLRSISPFSARRIIPMCASILNGSAVDRTERFSMPRIRPRNTRTSILSTSSRRPGENSGSSSCGSSASGSSRGSASSGSTTRTPSRSLSGSG